MRTTIDELRVRSLAALVAIAIVLAACTSPAGASAPAPGSGAQARVRRRPRPALARVRGPLRAATATDGFEGELLRFAWNAAFSRARCSARMGSGPERCQHEGDRHQPEYDRHALRVTERF